MKIAFFTLTLGLLSQSAIAVETNVSSESNEPRSIESLLNEAKLEKLQAETMVEIMVKSGRFSNEQGERTRRSIASVHEEDLEAIKEEALANIKAPNLANK